MAKVTMPQLGESVAEGTIGKWLKKPGDHVAKYEPLLEVITDKVNAEVPSPYEGVLKEILVEEGATVPNNAEIAVIEDAGAATAGAAAPSASKAATDSAAASAPTAASSASAEPTPAAAVAPDEAREPDTLQPAAASNGPTSSPASTSAATAPPMASASAPSSNGPAGSDERVPHELPGSADARMTPAVRRLLREHGLSAAMIVGTGGGGRITREDVSDYVESQRTSQPVGRQDAAGGAATPASAPAPSTTAQASTANSASSAGPAPAPSAPAAPQAPAAASAASAPAAKVSASISFPAGSDEVLVPMTQMRKGIAAQMTRALQVPHAYVQMEVDVTNLVRFREKNKKEYQAREGVSLSFVPFVVKASADALKRNPTFNAHWTENGLLAKRRINIGIAVAVDDGLIVPVIRDVDNLSINGLNKAIAEVSERARNGKFQLDDFGGGTFTVDNTGWLGTNMVMPIINVPEVGIVTMDRITKRPVVVETPDGDVIAIRPIMNMVLGVDHRANDGAGGAALLRDIKSWLESVGPETPIY
ncbi:MAG TPA: dihydrolipoamide acetyltransferase family protein [Candidatus Limnocylindria bacterium]|nr:dihydrolipoamide acetyltransferase family protein [Candidatus Limnocylindria bacterium]